MEYLQWMMEVNNLLYEKLGLYSDELPDYEYLDSFQAGKHPDEVAPEVIHQAMACFGLAEELVERS